ncbi:MAG: ATP-binding protein, partial [Rikenellaceae bacterium]
MKPHNIVIIAAILICSILTSFANEAIRIGSNLNIENGLAHNGVSCAIQDSRGYLWVGTYDGLNRYGGTDITIYKNRIGEQLFQNNRILSVSEDPQDRLWIGTDAGVTLFDYSLNRYTMLDGSNQSEANGVTDIFISEDKMRMICVSSNNYIFIYDMEGRLTRIDKLPTNTQINDAIHFVNDMYVLATRRGLLIYDSKSGITKPVKSNSTQPVVAITKCNGNNIIVSYSKGLDYIEIQKKDDKYISKSLSQSQYKDFQVATLTIDSNNTLWIGCDNTGVWRLLDYAKNYGQQLEKVADLKRVSKILPYNDHVWVSTFDDGIFQFFTNKSEFNTFKNGVFRLPHITALDTERVLINNSSNATIYNSTTNKEESLPFVMDKKLDSQIKLFAIDPQQRVWIISPDDQNKVEVYRVENRKITRVESAELAKISEIQIYKSPPVEATIDGDGNLWIAYPNNLFRISINKDSQISAVESLSDNPLIKSISELSRPRVIYFDTKINALWVGTNRRGLFKIDLTEQQNKSVEELDICNFTHSAEDLSSVSSNFISAITRTSNGTLWVGTEQGGFCRATENEDSITFKTISERDGLSNNVVKSIIEDYKGNLWVGTNIGLNCYNTTNGNITTYRASDGLPFEGFWYQALYMNKEQFVFTGADKILTFNPEVFYMKRSLSRIYFDELKIFDTEVAPNQRYNGHDVLNSRLMDGDTLRLRYNLNVFSVGIDLVENQYAQSNTLYYRLAPLSDQWIKLEKNNYTISFNGVEPGRYTLDVCAYNTQGDRGEISSLHIYIPHPAWKSPIAYLLYMIVFMLIVVVVVYAIMSFQSLSHNLEIQTIEKGVNDDKLRYFSDISHELKTPLSLILAPVALLRERFSADVAVSAKLDIIKRQSKKLLELIDLTHGVEANDLKTLKLSPSLFSFDSMIDDITTDFGFIAQYDNKSFKVERGESIIAAEADRGMIEKIINNLLSNALKHTANGDDITLSYTANGNTITLSVKDCGYGIDAEDLPHIFERFYQARRSGGHNIGGTGIGLTFTKMLVELHGGVITVESELRVGTTFTIALPIVVDKPLPEEVKSPALNGEIIDYDDNSEIYIESEYSESTIFLVEDNQELRVLISEIIGKYFKVKSFSNGVELINALDSEWPDLIVSDVMMPEMDGYEVCDKVKSDIKTSHIPIILLTACSTVDDKIKGLQLGADSYIPKPFYPKHLITRIETLLHN